jgi:hypothetical protein
MVKMAQAWQLNQALPEHDEQKEAAKGGLLYKNL